MDLLHPIFKWLHIFAGVMWIGLLYFFNFVNGAFAGTMDSDTKKKVVPELVKGGENEGDTLSLAYDKMVAILIEGIKILDNEISIMKKDIYQLKMK